MFVDEPERSDDSHEGKETGYDPPNIMRYQRHTRTQSKARVRNKRQCNDNSDDKKRISQTLEDDIAVLKEGGSLLGCLGRETSGIFRHDRLTASRCDKKSENSINEEIVK
jgi:hypothetical protein